MEVHKARPVRSWRELISEIGVIIIGVLIALSAEQSVEWLHWQHEVRAAREALDAELSHDLGILQFRMAETACVNRRLTDLAAWRETWRSAKPEKLPGAIGTPSIRSVRTSAWEIVKTGQIASHIPSRNRLDYSRLYDLFENFGVIQRANSEAWAELQEFNGARALDEHDLMRRPDPAPEPVRGGAEGQRNRDEAARKDVRPLPRDRRAIRP